MTVKVAKKFAATALKLYPPYRWDEEQETTWMEAVIRELAIFADAVTEKGLQEMLRTRKGRGRTPPTPTVAECIEYCVEAKRWLDAEDRKQGKLPVAQDGDRPDDYGHATADMLIKEAALGRQAAQEGWIGELHAFICKHKRLPQGSEIGTCKAESKDTDRFIATALRDAGSDPKNSALAIVGQCAETILKRREELAQRALGGER